MLPFLKYTVKRAKYKFRLLITISRNF